MMTSVTISDDLRKRLKRLAAKYDTNQAEIIRRSLELFEHSENPDQSDLTDAFFQNISDPARRQQIHSFLSASRNEFNQQFPELAKLYQIFREGGFSLSESMINTWELPFKE